MSMANETIKESREMQEEHHSGPLKYVIVLVALAVGTLLTVWTGRMNLGAWNLPLALAIATTKGALVVLFFMHLAEHKGANRLVFGVSVFFVALLIVFVIFDLGTRFRAALPTGATAPQWEVGSPSGRYGGALRAPETRP